MLNFSEILRCFIGGFRVARKRFVCGFLALGSGLFVVFLRLGVGLRWLFRGGFAAAMRRVSGVFTLIILTCRGG